MKKNTRFAVLSILVFIILAVAFLADKIVPYDPLKASLSEAFQAPGREHYFGTDALGRDVFSRVLCGATTSVYSVLILVAVILLLGTFLGIVAGYFGGVADAVIMRAGDMMIAFPDLILAMAIAGILGPSLKNSMIAIAAVSWTRYARLSRSLVLKIRERDYVSAAIVTGSKTKHMLLAYMLPNALPTLIITATTDIGGMMLELAALSFLGFGTKPPAPEWGYMLNEGRACMQSAPWMMIFPGLAIFLVVVVFNMLGDSLRDILDPKSE